MAFNGLVSRHVRGLEVAGRQPEQHRQVSRHVRGLEVNEASQIPQGSVSRHVRGLEDHRRTLAILF